jgi:8-amino-7-oxononanoate synthase
LGPAEVIEYLINRAPSIIYTTALSPFDTLYAYCSLNWIEGNLGRLVREIKKRKGLFQTESLIKPIPVPDNFLLIKLKEELEERGIVVGAIRPPTVPQPILRLNLRLPVSISKIWQVVEIVSHLLGKEIIPRKPEGE